jgi:hypothetical protein
LGKRCFELRHINLDSTKDIVGEWELRDTAGFHPAFDPFAGQNASNEVQLGIIKGRVNFFPDSLSKRYGA